MPSATPSRATASLNVLPVKPVVPVWAIARKDAATTAAAAHLWELELVVPTREKEARATTPAAPAKCVSATMVFRASIHSQTPVSLIARCSAHAEERPNWENRARPGSLPSRFQQCSHTSCAEATPSGAYLLAHRPTSASFKTVAHLAFVSHGNLWTSESHVEMGGIVLIESHVRLWMGGSIVAWMRSVRVNHAPTTRTAAMTCGVPAPGPVRRASLTEPRARMQIDAWGHVQTERAFPMNRRCNQSLSANDALSFAEEHLAEHARRDCSSCSSSS